MCWYVVPPRCRINAVVKSPLTSSNCISSQIALLPPAVGFPCFRKHPSASVIPNHPHSYRTKYIFPTHGCFFCITWHEKGCNGRLETDPLWMLNALLSLELSNKVAIVVKRTSPFYSWLCKDRKNAFPYILSICTFPRTMLQHLYFTTVTRTMADVKHPGPHRKTSVC